MIVWWKLFKARKRAEWWRIYYHLLKVPGPLGWYVRRRYRRWEEEMSKKAAVILPKFKFKIGEEVSLGGIGPTIGIVNMRWQSRNGVGCYEIQVNKGRSTGYFCFYEYELKKTKCRTRATVQIKELKHDSLSESCYTVPTKYQWASYDRWGHGIPTYGYRVATPVPPATTAPKPKTYSVLPPDGGSDLIELTATHL